MHRGMSTGQYQAPSAPSSLSVPDISLGGLLLGGALGLGAAASVYWYYLHPEVRRDDGGIPGSRGLPFVGETLRYAAEGPDNFVKRRIAKYKSHIFSTSFLGSKTIVIASSGLLSQVLKNEKAKVKAKWQGPFLKLFGEHSILNVEGRHHKVQREAVLRVTNTDAMNEYAKHFINTFHETLAIWKSMSEKGELIDLQASYSELTFNSNARYLFGESFTQEVVDELRELVSVWKSGFQAIPIMIPGFQYHKAYEAWTRIADIIKEELNRRRSLHEPGRRQDLIDILSQNINPDTGKPYEFEPYLRHQIPTIMFGSLDTTISTELALMVKVSAFPGKLVKVREEVLALVRQKHGDKALPKRLPLSYVELSDAKALPYLHAFVKEALRVCVPATFAQRKAIADFDLTVGDKVFHIFKGDGMIISLKGVADSIEGLKDGLSFRPERFLEPELEQKIIPKNSLVAFGAGLRLCPGKNFAMTQVLTVLATLAYEGMHLRIMNEPKEAYDPTFVFKTPGLAIVEPMDL